VAPYVIAEQGTLAVLAQLRPSSAARLADVVGMGEDSRGRHRHFGQKVTATAAR
jgi:hypothetical protein